MSSKTEVRELLEELPVSFVAGIMNVQPQDIEDTIGGFAYCKVFWTDDYDFLCKVADVPTLTIRSDFAVAERWGIGEQELNNYVLYPSFIVTRGKFKDS